MEGRFSTHCTNICTLHIDAGVVQIGNALNSEFNTIAHHFKMVRYKGATFNDMPA